MEPSELTHKKEVTDTYDKLVQKGVKSSRVKECRIRNNPSKGRGPRPGLLQGNKTVLGCPEVFQSSRSGIGGILEDTVDDIAKEEG